MWPLASSPWPSIAPERRKSSATSEPDPARNGTSTGKARVKFRGLGDCTPARVAIAHNPTYAVDEPCKNQGPQQRALSGTAHTHHQPNDYPSRKGSIGGAYGPSVYGLKSPANGLTTKGQSTFTFGGSPAWRRLKTYLPSRVGTVRHSSTKPLARIAPKHPHLWHQYIPRSCMIVCDQCRFWLPTRIAWIARRGRATGGA